MFMSLFSSMRVDLPKSTYFQKRVSGTAVYQYTRHFRDSNGKPRHNSSMIGILDEESNRLIPNSNYFDINHISSPVSSFYSVQQYGYPFVFYHLCDSLGLSSILSSIFPDSWKEIVTTACYILIEGSTMDYLDLWQDNSFSLSSQQMNGKSCSRLFSSINEEQIHSFFLQWIKHFSENDCYFYDVTSISSYSGNIDMVEYGYNRDHEDLAQINIGMFCHNATRLPVYYEVYNGSLTDKMNLPYVIDNINELGIQNITLIMDGGFFDKERIHSLDNGSYSYTMGMPSHLKISKEIIKKYGNKITVFQNKLKKHPEYCLDLKQNIFDKERRILLCYNEVLHSDMMNGLMEKLELMEKELKGLKRYPKSHEHKYKKYFNLYETENGFRFSKNIDNINEICESFGYFLLFGNDMKTEAEELLYYYRAKDADEKIFMAIKNYMEGNRIRTHNSATTNGKIFIIFLTLIIRTELYRKLEDYLIQHHMSLKKALCKLNDIKIVQNGVESSRLLKCLTKEQRTLLALLNCDKLLEDSLSIHY